MSAVRIARLGAQLPKAAGPTQPEHYRAKAFYRDIVRLVPKIIEHYNLEELVTARQLNQYVGDMFRANRTVAEQKAVDMMVLRGQEELDLIMRHHKQRHHLITQYVHEPESRAAAMVAASREVISPFLQAFYKSN